ncbi:PIR protein [Plasmodium vivax]|uniref:VIR protein n=1 Tax=Plasmodium vivax TaxID=5855 RepID=A0A565A5J0_PLAVI|nr:PIR protein [Plasmodium vivax]
MMSQHGLYIPNLTSEEEAILKALPAFKIYDKFNNTGNTSKYNGSCETVSPNIREFKNLCTKFLHNIKNLPDYNHDRVNHKIHSKYLYYWIFHEINKISIANPNKINPSDVNRFLIIGNTWYSDLYHAPFIKEFNFDFEELKEQKYLYDYFKNFNALNEITCPHSNSRVYYKYVDFINKFYTKKIQEKQCCIWNFDCKPYFDCNDKYNPQYLFYKLKCGPHVDTLRWKQRHLTSRLYREGNGNDNEHHATHETDEYGNPLYSLRFSRILEGINSTSKFDVLRIGSLITLSLGIIYFFYVKYKSSTRKSKLLKEELERDSIMDSNYEMNMDELSEYSLEDENEDEDEHFGAPNRNLYFAYSPS